MEVKNYFATDTQGNVLGSAQVYLYLAGTTTLATGLQNISGAALGNPFTSDANGLVQFKAPDNNYDLRVVKPGREFTIRIQCFDGIAFAATVSEMLNAENISYKDTNVGAALDLISESIGVNPAKYGALGDGIHNDTEAFRLAAAEATLKGSRIVCRGLKRPLIDANAGIIHNCSIDWSGATIAVNGGINPSPSHSSINRMFICKDINLPARPITIPASEMIPGQRFLTVPEDVGNGMLYVSSNKRIGSRTSTPTVENYFSISHSLNRGGQLNYPIKTDLTSNTISCLFTPSPQTWIEIHGFTADESTFNNQCLFRIERGMTKIWGNAVQANGQNTMPNSVNYLVWCLNGINYVLEDMVINGQSTTGGSSYGIVLNNVCDVSMSRLYGRGRNTWGVMESDNVNGVYINDCNLNRIDVHQGMHNVFVTGGTLYDNGVQYGWGSGVIQIDGTTVIGNTSVCAARADYDGNFEGAIRIIDPIVNYGRQTPDSNGVALLIPIFNASALGGAYPTIACESLEIINPLCMHEGSGSGVILVRPFRMELANDSYQVRMPAAIDVDRVRSPKGKVVFSIDTPFDKFLAPSTGECKISVSNIDSRPYPTSSTMHRTVGPAAYKSPQGTIRAVFENVNGYTQYFAAPSARITLRGGSLACLKSFATAGPAQRITISNLDIEDTVAPLGGSTVGELGDASSEVVLNDVRVRSTANLALVDAAQGVLLLAGVSVTLPSSPSAVTPSQMYLGYKSATVYQ